MSMRPNPRCDKNPVSVFVNNKKTNQCTLLTVINSSGREMLSSKGKGTDDPVEKKNYFDAKLVCEAFEKCKENVAALSLENYLRGYMELYRFFGFLGSVFSFVASDVLSKITILEGYLNSEIGEHYMTIQAMITYENTNNLLRDPKRPSGARTLLRLHRALEFIAAFIGTISTLDSDGKTSTAAQECYNKTLAKFHPWLIQNAALLAMYTLPRKQQLLEKICDQQPPQDICVLMKQLQEVAVAVYDVTQNLYEEYNILDLP